MIELNFYPIFIPLLGARFQVFRPRRIEDMLLRLPFLTPCMKLHIVRTANRRISNIEPQNVEGWNRFAQSFFKIDRIHYFDIRHSLFDIRYSLFRVSFLIRLAVFLASGGAHMKLHLYVAKSKVLQSSSIKF
jgi:hypothetical protein